MFFLKLGIYDHGWQKVASTIIFSRIKCSGLLNKFTTTTDINLIFKTKMNDIQVAQNERRGFNLL